MASITQEQAEILRANRDRIMADYGFVFDPTHHLSYGYWSHECGASFYGGGEAMHKQNCRTASGYKGCTYHFGPKEVQGAKDHAERNEGNEDYPMHLGPLTLGIIRARYPELI